MGIRPRPNSGTRYSLDMGKIQPFTRGEWRSTVAVAWFCHVHWRWRGDWWWYPAFDYGFAFGRFHAEEWYFRLILLRGVHRTALVAIGIVAGTTLLSVAALSAVIAVAPLTPFAPVTAPAFLAVVAAAAFTVTAVIAALLIITILLLGHIGAEDQRIFQCFGRELVLGRTSTAVTAAHNCRSKV